MSPHATSLRLALLIVTVAACAGARAQPPQVWSTLAAEGQPFTVQGTRTVRYGAGDHWVAKSVTGAGECSNAWFGTDPAYMVAKTCEVQVAAGAPTGGAASVSKAAALPPATGTLSGMEIALFSTTGGTKPFTIGQALRQGDVARDKTVTADVPSVQCIVKNRWPDGTLKFVILSGQADLTANTWRRVRLAVAEHPGAEPAISVDALKSAGTTASIQFAPFGTAEWFPAKERGLAGGLFNIGASVGSMLAPPLVAWAILTRDWRFAFVVTGVGVVFTGVVFGTIYARSGRLWMLMCAHAAFDLAAYAMIYWNLETSFAHLIFK